MESISIKNIYNAVISILSMWLIISCASQIPPSGGDVDKTPPEIEELYPANGTTNFSDDYFEITFSEYVDKRSVKEAVFISPRLEHGIELDWSGTTLTVYFKDTLKENTTYNISIGTDVKDINNNNNMAEAYNFAFSTGDKIDKGIVEGKVFDNNPTGILIFAYKKINDNYPSPVEVKPDNITQVGKNGKYKLLGLSNGDFRVFAVRDDFKDFLYNVEDDQYGIQSKEVSLSDVVQQINDLDFMMTEEDTTEPHIYNITMTDRYHILLEFSEYIDSSRISADNFYVYDSTDNKRIGARYLYKGEAKAGSSFIVLNDTLNINNENNLFVENLYDNFGNVLVNEGTKFTASDRPDTTAPKLAKKITEYNNSQVDFEDAYVEFIFNDAFDVDNLIDDVKIFDLMDNAYKTEVIKIDDASFMVKSSAKLQDKSDYQIKIDLKKIRDAAGNFIDSVYTFKFSTINSLQFSGASGKVITEHSSKEVLVVLKKLDTPKRDYVQNVNPNYEFSFERVIPGNYLIWSFFDADSNGEYSYGKINPFEKSEEFIYYPDTLTLKARWPVGDIYLNY